MATEPKHVLRTKAAAAYLGLAASTLERFRQQGHGPHFVRLGKRAIGYRIRDLDAWLDDSDKDPGNRRPIPVRELSARDADQPRKRRS
jgi:predicted DNA-binding transcriptional regulator AlpA